MGIARTSLKGVTQNISGKTYNGYTLFTPLGKKETVLIDMGGKVVHKWKMPYIPALYGVLLSNDNLLYSGHAEEGPLANFKGAGGALLEVNWDGNVTWNYRDPYSHHSFYRLRNGNTMVLRWVQVPGDIAASVKGGIPGTEQNGIMWCDSLREINPRGKVTWEWLGYEHLDPDVDIICPLCPRDQWTEANSFAILSNGDVLVSFMRTNTICIIDEPTGAIKWRWGSGELSHQSDVSMLENGNILLFDNGTHCISFSVAYSRALEVNPVTNEMVWEYKDNPWMAFYSAYMSNCQRLPNGNTLMCEAMTGRIFEVTKEGDIVWEFVNPFPSSFDSTYGRHRIIPKAYRYGPDYEGLPGNTGIFGLV